MNRARIAAWWDDFMFAPLSPHRLGIARMLYYLGLYWAWFGRPSVLNPNYLSVVRLPPEYLFPQSVFHYLPIATGSDLDVLTLLLKIVLVLGALGFLTRITSVLVFALVFYLMSVPNMYGRVIIIHAIPVMVTGILACSRAGDAFSIDRLIRDRWSRWPLVTGEPQPSGHYRWPVQVICIYATLAFSFAALNKLGHTGLAWVFSDNLSLMFRANLQNQACLPLGGGGRITELANWVGEQRWLCKLLAGGTVLVELSSPAALFLRGWLRAALVAGLVASTVSFYFLVGADAWPIVCALIFFIPWERVWGLVARTRAPARP